VRDCALVVVETLRICDWSYPWLCVSSLSDIFCCSVSNVGVVRVGLVSFLRAEPPALPRRAKLERGAGSGDGAWLGLGWLGLGADRACGHPLAGPAARLALPTVKSVSTQGNHTAKHANLIVIQT